MRRMDMITMMIPTYRCLPEHYSGRLAGSQEGWRNNSTIFWRKPCRHGGGRQGEGQIAVSFRPGTVQLLRSRSLEQLFDTRVTSACSNTKRRVVIACRHVWISPIFEQ